MDGDKIKAILDMPEPRQSQSEIRSFLGAVGFYRRWLSNYSEMAAPLVELLSGKEKKVSPERWTARQSEAVTALKKAITRYPVTVEAIRSEEADLRRDRRLRLRYRWVFISIPRGTPSTVCGPIH